MWTSGTGGRAQQQQHTPRRCLVESSVDPAAGNPADLQRFDERNDLKAAGMKVA